MNATVLLASSSSLVGSEYTMAFKRIVYSLRPAQWCLTFFCFFNPKQRTHRVFRKPELKPAICIIISEYHVTPNSGVVTNVSLTFSSACQTTAVWGGFGCLFWVKAKEPIPKMWREAWNCVCSYETGKWPTWLTHWFPGHPIIHFIIVTPNSQQWDDPTFWYHMCTAWSYTSISVFVIRPAEMRGWEQRWGVRSAVPMVQRMHSVPSHLSQCQEMPNVCLNSPGSTKPAELGRIPQYLSKNYPLNQWVIIWFDRK